MRGGGCWSSIVATPDERSALHLTPTHDWLVACVLPAGHDGAHGSDGAQSHSGRRRWLMWDDYARGAQTLAEEFECPSQALDGAPCLFFAGHGGPHRYAAPVGRDFPAEPVVDGAPSPAPVPKPRSAPASPPPLPPEDESFSVSALDDLFAGMPSLRDLPTTDLLVFPESSFHPAAPAWPQSRGDYVAEHRPDGPHAPEAVVSGPARFEPAEQVIDAEVVEAPAAEPKRGRRRRLREDADPALRPAEAGRSRHRAAHDAEDSAGAAPVDPNMLEVRPGAASVLTTPMVEVISSSWDPVRMGIPVARRPLPGDSDVWSVAEVVEGAAAHVRSLPEAAQDGEVSAALLDVAESLGRLADALKPSR
ncbi:MULTISPECIES: hypothetical protein [Gordonia]|uniref:Uncharacterized protein n=1 Tax=Gordonia cholesterolivorans TaxID=559625 RepID=A0ABN3H498_9ACTN|nr:hypothetical protein [Gordonia sihwensis]MBY4568729.1 hypothetical protein [Gordonia sihwensis]